MDVVGFLCICCTVNLPQTTIEMPWDQLPLSVELYCIALRRMFTAALSNNDILQSRGERMCTYLQRWCFVGANAGCFIKWSQMMVPSQQDCCLRFKTLPHFLLLCCSVSDSPELSFCSIGMQSLDSWSAGKKRSLPTLTEFLISSFFRGVAFPQSLLPIVTTVIIKHDKSVRQIQKMGRSKHNTAGIFQQIESVLKV